MRALRLLGLLAAPLLGACRGAQSILDPASSQARDLDRLWWLFLGINGAIYVLVMIALVTAIVRRRRPGGDPDPEPAPAGERRHALVVATCALASVLVLFVLTTLSYSTGRSLSAPPDGVPLSVRVVGHQWWWELHYEAEKASDIVTTANELHLPAGRPVFLRLQSTDVIHSLWIPSLQGKRDLIPGRTTNVALRADRPGTYRGQCAEFCGAQHALMALDVVVEPSDQFDAWLAHERGPAAAPASDLEERGRQVFASARCPSCHAITGSDAHGLVGPDLTHVASRRSLAAGAIPNTRGHRAGWIVDPQGVKPGTRMPSNQLPPDDLQALLAYLERLE
jgi:cytochrome c oxidase subunit 2